MPMDLRSPPRLPLIAPSILSADFAKMGEDCRAVLKAGGDLLHLDVMDGHFVPNLTMGPDMCRGLRRALPDVFLDVHLMVREPGRFVEPFVSAGANHITFHVEVLEPGGLKELADTVRRLGATVGLALNPPTPVDRVLPLLPEFDLILVMSVNPGFSGQAFIPDVLAKARAIRPRLASSQRLEIDGGINLKTARSALEAGCDVLVAASAIFGRPESEWAEVISGLRE
jgi:ribulose-phosphate 3-epimerase